MIVPMSADAPGRRLDQRETSVPEIEVQPVEVAHLARPKNLPKPHRVKNQRPLQRYHPPFSGTPSGGIPILAS